MKKILFAVAAILVSAPAFAADTAAPAATPAAAAAAKAPAAKASAAKGDDAIKAVFEKIDMAFEKHDVKLFAELFAEDATFVGPMGDAKVVKGRAEIMKYHEHMMMEPAMKDATAKHTVENIRWISKTEAFVDASVVFTGMKMDNMPAGAPMPVWHAVALVTSKGGKWLLTDVRPYMVMPAPVAAPAPAKM